MPGDLEGSLHTAVDALKLLDKGNRMIETCAGFLNRLGHVISLLSKPYRKTSLQFPPKMLISREAADDSIGSAFQPLIPGTNDHALLNSHSRAMPVSAQLGSINYQSQLEPLGMDLGEFLIESDLDFLNYFPVN